MATINPNIPQLSITAQLTGSTGAAAAQQQARVAGTNFGNIQNTLDQSQQALQALVAMSAGWIGIGSGMGIGDGSTASLGAALSTQYMAMTMGSPGFASDLTSLESPLRHMYGGLAGGAADNFQAMAAPLAGQYAGMMQIQGMPPTPPLGM